MIQKALLPLLNNYRRLFSFMLIGGVGSLVNLIALYSLIHLGHFSAVPAYLIALELSIINNFCFNNYLTFRQSSSSSYKQTSLVKRFSRYQTVTLSGALISFMAFYSLFQLLNGHYIIADILGIALGTFYNYWLSVKIVWPKRAKKVSRPFVVDNEISA